MAKAWRDAVVIGAGLVLGVLLAVYIVDNEHSENSRELIYSPEHLVTEMVILLAALFLIVEASIHIRAETDRRIRPNFCRYVRILIGSGIITVHVMVLACGGY